jgi:hypothetical protein
MQDWVSTSQHDFMSGAERQVDRARILETFTLRRSTEERAAMGAG